MSAAVERCQGLVSKLTCFASWAKYNHIGRQNKTINTVTATLLRVQKDTRKTAGKFFLPPMLLD